MWLKIKSTFARLITPSEDLQDALYRDAFYEGLYKTLYGIPTDAELKNMSDTKLAELHSSNINGSPKFFVVEREYKRRLAVDQAKINRKNILLGAIIGGSFTIIGYLLKN